MNIKNFDCSALRDNPLGTGNTNNTVEIWISKTNEFMPDLEIKFDMDNKYKKSRFICIRMSIKEFMEFKKEINLVKV